MARLIPRSFALLACICLVWAGCADNNLQPGGGSSNGDSDAAIDVDVPDTSDDPPSDDPSPGPNDAGTTEETSSRMDAVSGTDGETGTPGDGGLVADADGMGDTDGGGYVTPGGDAGKTCQNDDDCAPPPFAISKCNASDTCAYKCKPGRVDRDGQIWKNGCECELTNGGQEACDQKDNDCDGKVDENFDLMSDPDHCGGCGNTCMFNHGMGTCKSGTCQLASCRGSWANCDKKAMNGCEINTDDSERHCGSCGNACDPSDGTGVCRQGTCRLDACDSGYADCNNNPRDGCEANTQGDPDHCGGCGLSCDSSRTQGVGCRNGSCYLKSGCQPGWGDCNGDIRSDGCEQNLNNSTSHCGACNNQCNIPNARNACKQGTCVLERCRNGYKDLNGKKSDGCEYKCTFQSADDEPDRKGEDANCDGIDGVKSESVFVATPSNGGDANNGGRALDAPVASIGKAIQIAEGCNPTCDVLVSAGTYDETIEVKPGVDVYGGYTAKDWDRDVTTHRTVVEGQKKRTLIATNIDESTEYDGLTIRGRDFRSGGKSTYAVWVEDSSNKNFEINNSRVESGDGGDGRNGLSGLPGADGKNGGSANSKNGASGGSSACSARGGDGGSSSGCDSNGGDRGRNGGSSAGGGRGGSGGKDFCGGTVGLDCGDEGGTGGDGNDGNDGDQGSGGDAPTDSFGDFSGGFWSGKIGSAGTDGSNGRGGGGGGSGGADRDPLGCGNELLQGGGGGGGGAGGCGGNGGDPGKPGGGSFAIVLVDSEIAADSTTVIIGNGGDGGDGGDGGGGGAGGNGGNGDNGSGGSTDGGGPGGDGGDGGAGGGGGGGAGGCGGPAIGLVKVGSANFDTQNVNYRSGNGGAGGDGGNGGARGGSSSSAPDGEQGCRGSSTNVKTY